MEASLVGTQLDYLGPSMSGTCRKLLLFGFGAVGGDGAARANISATGTCNQ